MKKLAERLFPPLFTFTELLAITVTTLSPPKKLLIPVTFLTPLVLLMFDLLFSGSNLSAALIPVRLNYSDQGDGECITNKIGSKGLTKVKAGRR